MFFAHASWSQTDQKPKGNEDLRRVECFPRIIYRPKQTKSRKAMKTRHRGTAGSFQFESSQTDQKPKGNEDTGLHLPPRFKAPKSQTDQKPKGNEDPSRPNLAKPMSSRSQTDQKPKGNEDCCFLVHSFHKMPRPKQTKSRKAMKTLSARRVCAVFARVPNRPKAERQ